MKRFFLFLMFTIFVGMVTAEDTNIKSAVVKDTVVVESGKAIEDKVKIPVTQPTNEKNATTRPSRNQIVTIKLPQPKGIANIGLNELLSLRKDFTTLSSKPLKIDEISELLWAGIGMTDKLTGRSTIGPLAEKSLVHISVLIKNGVYQYNPQLHSLSKISDQDQRERLKAAAGNKDILAQAPCHFIISISEEGLRRNRKLSWKIGNIEAGKAAQNIELKALSMGIASVSTGDFETSVRLLIRGDQSYEPVLIMSLGWPLTTDEVSFDPSVPITQNTTITQTETTVTDEQANQVKKRVAIIIPTLRFVEQDLFAAMQAFNAMNVDVDIASFTLETIRGDSRGTAKPVILVGNINPENYDGLVLISSIASMSMYDNDLYVANLSRYFISLNKPVCAIGKTPGLLGQAGLLNGLDATSHFSQRKNITRGGGTYNNIPVQLAGLIITSQGTEDVSSNNSYEGTFAVSRAVNMMTTIMQGKNPLTEALQKRQDMTLEELEAQSKTGPYRPGAYRN